MERSHVSTFNTRLLELETLRAEMIRVGQALSDPTQGSVSDAIQAEPQAW